MFVNRKQELTQLERWHDEPRGRLGLVWGRRRVGKTALIQEFSRERKAIFHTAAGRPVTDELRLLSQSVAKLAGPGLRDLEARPFTDWDDALDMFATLATRERLLVVIDEFPELV